MVTQTKSKKEMSPLRIHIEIEFDHPAESWDASASVGTTAAAIDFIRRTTKFAAARPTQPRVEPPLADWEKELLDETDEYNDGR